LSCTDTIIQIAWYNLYFFSFQISLRLSTDSAVRPPDDECHFLAVSWRDTAILASAHDSGSSLPAVAKRQCAMRSPAYRKMTSHQSTVGHAIELFWLLTMTAWMLGPCVAMLVVLKGSKGPDCTPSFAGDVEQCGLLVRHAYRALPDLL